MSPAAKAILAITGLSVTCVLYALVSWARKSEQRHLLASGARVSATVVFVGREQNQARMPMILRYRFTPAGADTVVEGRCTVGAFPPYKAGDTAVICYNKAHPQSSIILTPQGTPL